ncbi:MAG: isoprenylcysteine carboxylmethyltransferase family protein [Salaquimonas sp.]
MHQSFQKVLPPVLFVLLILPLIALQIYHPDFGTMREERSLPWDIVLPFGLALLIIGRLQFKKHNAEIMTFSKPRNLVTSGVYQISRNPMYLGFALLLLAAALYVNTWCALIAPLVFIAVANWYYIPFEEKAAKEEFGVAYETYQKRVRRWI